MTVTRRPGPLRRAGAAVGHWLGGFLPGAAARRIQVPAFATQWRCDNAVALRGTGPLWVVLGDSASQAIGASDRRFGYVLRVLETLRRDDPDWRVVNLSVTGARIGDVLDTQLPALADVPAPRLVSVAIGMNDLRHHTPDLPELMTRLIRDLPPGSVVATIPQGMHAREAQQMNALITATAAERGVAVADVWSRTGPPWKGKFSADLFHPNDAGYRDWADAFLPAVGTALGTALDRAGGRDPSPSEEPG